MSNQETKRWWQYGHVWLIIAGPALVIIASFITLYLAISRPDPAIDDYYRKGMEINKTLDAQRDGLAPALQARNHAATGIKPVK
ncbi:MAG TPA: nitrogen fixation protein FixH [Methylophilaceae bacterium]|nr:nitrogen fixation protein FixH [Methylophilaceae bacterium]HAJ72561.1 nitrogen fixation protein FixH [Methylophilaceae bacterium]